VLERLSGCVLAAESHGRSLWNDWLYRSECELIGRLFMKSCWTLLRCTVSFLGNETRENPWFSKKYYANMQCSASKSETMQGTRSAMMHLCIFFFLRSCICVFWIDTRPLVTCTPSGTSEMAESMRRSFPCLKFWTWSSLLTNVHSSFLASDNDLHHEA
jgi:hypothetical protein